MVVTVTKVVEEDDLDEVGVADGVELDEKGTMVAATQYDWPATTPLEQLGPTLEFQV